MLRDYHYIWRALFIVCDLGLAALVFLLSYQLRFLPVVTDRFGPETPPQFLEYVKVLPVLMVLLWVTQTHFRLYHPRRISSFLDEFADLVKSNVMAVLLLMTFFFFNRSFSYARTIVVIFLVLNPLSLMAFRLFLRSGLRLLRSKGYNQRHILIVGTGRPAQALIHRLRRNRWTGIRIRGLVSLGTERVGATIHDVPVVGHVEEFSEVLDRVNADQVYIAIHLSHRQTIGQLIRVLSDRLIPVRLIPDVGLLFANDNVADFDGLPVLRIWENRLQGWNAFSKRLLDIGIASLGLVGCWPLFLLIGCAIKLTSRGPVFFLQQRMGLDGSIFPILKFRTMRHDAEDRPGWTTEGDDRCTRLGRFLRRTSLDELPQLFNVLIGQMSLVGPRPERPVLIEKFRRKIPRYMMRHQIKAGMTGWAQVNGWRGNTSLRKRVQYDLYYLQNWSIWFDVKIILLTILRGFAHRNAH